jgi:hypothetical protein
MMRFSLNFILKCFVKGFITNSLIVIFIHLYSYFFEDYFTYSEPLNLLGTIVIGGVGMGMVFWSYEMMFKSLKKN